MYLQTSRLQYNLQGFGVFQTARSNKNIQASACVFDYNNLFANMQVKQLSLRPITRVWVANCATRQVMQLLMRR